MPQKAASWRSRQRKHNATTTRDYTQCIALSRRDYLGACSIIFGEGGLEKGGLLEGGLRSPLPRGGAGGGGGQKLEGLKGGLKGA